MRKANYLAIRNPQIKHGLSSCSPEGYVVPVPLVALACYSS